MCAHCLYGNDADAQAQLERLFSVSGKDPSPYLDVINILGPPAAPQKPPHLHAFIGVQAGTETSAYTVYLNPNLSAGENDPSLSR